MCVLLLGPRETFVWKENGTVDADGQPPMTAAQHDGAEHEFAGDVPRAAETVCVPRYAGADSHTSVRRHDLEDDVERGEHDWISLELAGFDRRDDEHRQGDPPQVVAELRSQLLTDEVLTSPG